MPEYDYEKLKKEAEQYIKFEKDKKNRIAYITFDRPDAQNATTLGMRQNYADLIHKCNVDDDVKVVVIRGEGQDFGSGGDLPEQRPMLENPGLPLHHELAINDDDVKYPPGGSYRYLSTVTDFYAKARAGNRPLQELRKISIIEAKGYCYGWHFYQAGDADLVISSDDALFGHPAFRYVGWGPRLWWWAETMGLRKFSEMLFTGRPFSAKEMYDCGFVNSVVPRDKLEAETAEVRAGVLAVPPDRHRRGAEDLPGALQAAQGRILRQPAHRHGRGHAADDQKRRARGRPHRGHLRKGTQQRGQGQRPELPAGVAPEPLGTQRSPDRLGRAGMSALTGIRVVELAGSVAGEYCGKLLADFGAEVIKIEAPGCGSPTRAMAPILGDGAGCEGSALFAYLNTNKQSVVLDGAAAERLDEIIGTADAVIDDRATSTGRERHPDVVFCSITPFGQLADAEFGNAKSINVFHASGWGFHTPSHADPADPPLQGPGRFLADYEAGLEAALCVASSLFGRLHTGQGDVIDVSATRRARFARRLHRGPIHHGRGAGRR